ncbi:hypothetical protein TNCV_340581 [Trichonephila clavipes]|uniref:Uncharacterized protein n=1 Tax=Trichonephila clavipes TaxID=2585209 RepID=A0A8X6VKC3_TRICX|nr:hypothetical protein TNCV_340581 [Trichonephila clavipes]
MKQFLKATALNEYQRALQFLNRVTRMTPELTPSFSSFHFTLMGTLSREKIYCISAPLLHAQWLSSSESRFPHHRCGFKPRAGARSTQPSFLQWVDK